MIHKQARRNGGFTIVELLIVIVVIGILAAIVIIAFNGVQNNAYDTSVKSNLTAAAKTLELYKAESESNIYPIDDTELVTMTSGSKYKIKINANAYGQTANNLAYCKSGTTGAAYALIARTRTSKVFYVSSAGGGVKEFTGTFSSIASGGSCPSFEPSLTTGHWGFQGTPTRTWQSWVTAQ